MASQNSFKKGNIELLSLAILRTEDCYAYQITQAIKQLSNGLITVTEGALYQILYRLADLGYVTAEEHLVSKRMRRVYYHLEEAGEAYFRTLLKEYRKNQLGIQKILDVMLEKEGKQEND